MDLELLRGPLGRSPPAGTAGSREPLPPGTQAVVCLPRQLFLLPTLLPHGVELLIPGQLAHLPFMLGVSWWQGPEKRWRIKRRGVG